MFTNTDSIRGFRLFGIEYFNRYYSLYRGIVVDNDDPTGQMRLQIIIPTVTGRGSPQWSYPRNVFAGGDYYLKAIPDIGDGIWVEFERGKMSRPIWSHMHPVETKLPSEIIEKDNIFFQTKYGHTIEIAEENITIKHKDGHLLEMNLEEVLIKHKDESTAITLAESLIKLNKGDNEGIIIGSKLQLELDKLHDNIVKLLEKTSTDMFACLPYSASGVPPPSLTQLLVELNLPNSKPKVDSALNENVTH